MIKNYKLFLKIIFYNLIIIILSLTLAGVIFSSKRNSHGVFFSDNINSLDLPKRINQANQIQIIDNFLKREISKLTKSQNAFDYIKNDNYDCKNNYLNYFRKNSDYSFMLPSNFKYQLKDVSIENYETPSLLFIGYKKQKKKNVYITKCKNNWMVQF